MEQVTEKKIDSKVESVDVKDKGAQYAESKRACSLTFCSTTTNNDVADTYKSVLQSVSA